MTRPAGSGLELVRFRLEGIDTGWKVVTARRVLPDEVEPKPKPAEPAVSKSKTVFPGESRRSPGDVALPP